MSLRARPPSEPGSTSWCRARAWPAKARSSSPARSLPARRRLRRLYVLLARGAAEQRVVGCRAGAGKRTHVANRQCRPARLAQAVLVDGAAAGTVFEDDRRTATRGRVAVAPLHQRDHRRPQVQALLGEAVFVARRVLLIEALFEHALLEQPR